MYITGTQKAGVAFTLSLHSNKTLEEVSNAAPDALRLMQIYCWRKPFILDIVHRAEIQGYFKVV